MLALVLVSVVIVVLALSVVVVTWLGAVAKRWPKSRLARTCETVAGVMNGDVDPVDVFAGFAHSSHTR